MKPAQLIKVLVPKAKDKWPDAETVSVSVTIEFTSLGSDTVKYRVFSMAHRKHSNNNLAADSDIISFYAYSINECIKIFEEKVLELKRKEQIDLD